MAIPLILPVFLARDIYNGDMMNLANILTIVRLVLLPAIIILFYIEHYIPGARWAAWSALVLYVTGAVTDWLDGWVARKFNQVSDLGTFLDPIADKIFVMAILLMLITIDRITGIWVLAVIIIMIREFLVAGLREFLGPKDVKLPVMPLAKWKTAIQMVALAVLIVAPYITAGHIVGITALCIAAGLTVVTGWKYLQTAWPHLIKDT